MATAVVALAGAGWAAGIALVPGRPEAGAAGAAAVLACLVSLVFGLEPVRSRLARMLWRSRLVREWDAACRFAGLATHNDRVPRIVHAERTTVGERLRVRLPKGAAMRDLEDRIEYLTAALEVAEVQAVRDGENARYGWVEVIRRDLLDESGPVPWPWAEAWRHGWQVSLWDHPLPIAMAGDGTVVYLELFDRGGQVHDGGEG